MLIPCAFPTSACDGWRTKGVAIIERSRRLSGRAPSFELIDDSELRLTIPSAAEGTWT